VSEEIAERIAKMDADEQAATPASTLAPDAVLAEPPKGKAKRGKAAHAATSGKTKTGPAYAADGTLKTVSIPADEPTAAPEPKPERKGRKPKAAKEPKAKSGHAHEGGGHARGDLETRAVG
jgi:hypothetical protein